MNLKIAAGWEANVRSLAWVYFAFCMCGEEGGMQNKTVRIGDFWANTIFLKKIIGAIIRTL